MPQITIYLDEEAELRARKAANSEGISLSKWIARVVREKAVTAWPKDILDMAGTWPDFPSAEELRNTQPDDAKRERL